MSPVSHTSVILKLRQNGGQSLLAEGDDVHLSTSLSLLPPNVQSSPSAFGSLIKLHTEDNITILKGISSVNLQPE